MFKAEDVSKLNRIYEQMGYATFPKRRDRPKKSVRPQSARARMLVREKGSMTYDKRPSVRMKIDYRAVAKQYPKRKRLCKKEPKKRLQRRPDDVRRWFSILRNGKPKSWPNGRKPCCTKKR